MWVLYGSDDQAIRMRRAELLGRRAVEQADCTEDGGLLLSEALGSPSLFGGERYVYADNLQDLVSPHLERIVSLLPMSDATVVARASTLPVALKRALDPVATLEKFDTPRAHDVPGRVRQLAKLSQVTLSNSQVTLLATRSGHDLDRIASVLNALSIAGMQHPLDRQLEVLIGTTAAPGVPWNLADALDAGNLGKALDAAAGLEAIPVIAYLANRALEAALVAEASADSVEAATAAAGTKSTATARRALDTSKRLGVPGTRKQLQALRGVDRAVKHASGRDSTQAQLDQAVVDLAHTR